MKILMSSHHKRNINSGASGTVERIGLHLQAFGNDVDFIFWDDFKYFFKNPNISLLFEFPQKLYKHINKKGYDIIDVRGSVGYLLGKKPHPGKYIFRNGGLDTRFWKEYYLEQMRLGFADYSFKFRWGMKKTNQHEYSAIKGCDGVIVMSNEDKDFIENEMGIKGKEISVIPGGIENYPDSCKNFISRKRDIAVIGWWGYIKGYPYIIEALKNLIKTFPGLKITFFGFNPEIPEFKSNVAGDLLNHLEVKFGLTNRELLEALGDHKILLVPSLFEGFGKVVPEGMAMGNIIIATEVGAAKDLIKDGINGVLIRKRNSNDIVEKVTYVLNNPDKFQELSLNAREFIKDYTWKNISLKTVQFYERIIKLNK